MTVVAMVVILAVKRVIAKQKAVWETERMLRWGVMGLVVKQPTPAMTVSDPWGATVAEATAATAAAEEQVWTGR